MSYRNLEKLISQVDADFIRARVAEDDKTFRERNERFESHRRKLKKLTSTGENPLEGMYR